jgi:hypothetical protein
MVFNVLKTGMFIVLLAIIIGCGSNGNKDSTVELLWKSVEKEQDTVKQITYLCNLCQYQAEVDKALARMKNIYERENKKDDWGKALDCYLALGEKIIENGNNKMLLFYASIPTDGAFSEMTASVIYRYACKYPNDFFSLSNVKELLEKNGGAEEGFDNPDEGKEATISFRTYAKNKNAPNRNIALEYADKIDKIDKKWQEEINKQKKGKK